MLRRRGFTLIELLVVIAIIAILAAILFPVFARARDKARQTACISNCKQIGTAVMMYAQDYDERYPGRWVGWNLPPKTPRQAYISWRELIQPYVKSVDVFRCPSNSINTTSSAADINDRYLTPPIPSSYSANGDRSTQGRVAIGGDAPMDSQDRAHFLAQIEQPAQLIFITENRTARLEVCLWCANVELFAGHSRMTNFIFCDGHAKALRPTATGRPINMWAVNKQNEPGPDVLMGHLQRVEAFYP
jgi:prepilin-type N-terminal cleavage/methylation domain-containing protein/prepilin-type processing-associated H-X9-DG protein